MHLRQRNPTRLVFNLQMPEPASEFFLVALSEKRCKIEFMNAPPNIVPGFGDDLTGQFPKKVVWAEEETIYLRLRCSEVDMKVRR